MTDTERRINDLEKTVYGNGQPGLKDRVTKLEAEHNLKMCAVAAEPQQQTDSVKLSGDNLKNIIIIILLALAAASPFASKLL